MNMTSRQYWACVFFESARHKEKSSFQGAAFNKSLLRSDFSKKSPILRSLAKTIGGRNFGHSSPSLLSRRLCLKKNAHKTKLTDLQIKHDIQNVK